MQPVKPFEISIKIGIGIVLSTSTKKTRRIRHKLEISKWFTKVYRGPVLSCGYFGSVERITGDTKHIGSELKICQETIHLVLKVSIQNMLVSV